MKTPTTITATTAPPRPRHRAVRLGAVLALVLAAAGRAGADTFVVTTVADSGAGSLRQAILDANARQVTGGTQCAGHTIQFAIAGTGTHTIRPLSALPRFTIPITLDGYSQPGSSANTLIQGSNAVIAIELDGSLAGATDAIVIGGSVPGSLLCSGSGSVIRGLVINRFAGAAVSMGEEFCPSDAYCPVGAVVIQGNYIGTDVTGSSALGNGFGLLRPALYFGRGSTYNLVGDEIATEGGPNDPVPATRNVISGNAGDGVYVGSPRATALSARHRIRNNYIGIAANGGAAVPNGGRGVVVDLNGSAIAIHDNLIGANVGDGVAVLDSPVPGTSLFNNGIGIGLDAQAFGNGGHGVHVAGSSVGVTVAGRFRGVPTAATIANNAGAGLYVEGTALVDVVGLSVAHNGGLAIDLAPTGVTPNDPGDADTGPNELLNAPVLRSAIIDASSLNATIVGSLDAAPNSSYEIAFYLDDTCDASGYGGGQTYFSLIPAPSVVRVTTDAAGHAAFSRQTPGLPAGRFLTALTRRLATATAVPAYIASEFSACRQVALSTDLIFADDFD